MRWGDHLPAQRTPKKKDEEAKSPESEEKEGEGELAANDEKGVANEEDDEVEPGLPDPLYLRVTMGKPVDRKLDRDAAILADGEQDLKAFYWFMIRPGRARKFHDFVTQTFPPGKYGLLDHMAVERGGYEVIREGVAILESEAGKGTNRASIAQLAR